MSKCRSSDFCHAAPRAPNLVMAPKRRARRGARRAAVGVACPMPSPPPAARRRRRPVPARRHRRIVTSIPIHYNKHCNNMSQLSKTSVNKLTISVFYDLKTRSSFCWKYFGHLILTNGKKKKVVNPEQVYCLACLDAVKEESEDIAFGW